MWAMILVADKWNNFSDLFTGNLTTSSQVIMISCTLFRFFFNCYCYFNFNNSLTYLHLVCLMHTYNIIIIITCDGASTLKACLDEAFAPFLGLINMARFGCFLFLVNFVAMNSLYSTSLFGSGEQQVNNSAGLDPWLYHATISDQEIANRLVFFSVTAPHFMKAVIWVVVFFCALIGSLSTIELIRMKVCQNSLS